LSLQINWHYTIPGKGFERSGAIDETSMFIAYWYPEIAVMDDINGWDIITYDASAEFYHDKSDFKVQIEAPKNYVLWATVAPLNGSEIYPQEIAKRLTKARQSTDPVVILDSLDYQNGIEMVSGIWRYEAKGFPDFSFALSDHFDWHAGIYEDRYGTYFLNAAFAPNQPYGDEVIKGQQASLNIFHNDFPAYPFPFKYFTVFNGLEGGGMEFPGMANNQASSGVEYSRWTGSEVSDYEANLGVTLHEMFHMYFPFLMGINEKRFGWMDEGWADFADYFTPNLFSGDWDQTYLGHQFVVPMMVPTYTTPRHSGINSYTIGSYSYYSLYHLLGEDVFKKAMNEYINRWQGKHPTPYDYFFTFNNVTGMNLNWFWERWYFDWGYPDLGIVAYANNQLTIENVGGRPLAFKLTYTYNDNTTASEIVSPTVWQETNKHTMKVEANKEIVTIQLSILGGSDALLENNWWLKD